MQNIIYIINKLKHFAKEKSRETSLILLFLFGIVLPLIAQQKGVYALMSPVPVTPPITFPVSATPTPSIKITIVPFPTKTPTPTPINCTPCQADINKDGYVTILDFSIFSTCYGKPVNSSFCARADIIVDGMVNQTDLICLQNMFGRQCILPTPITRPTATPTPIIKPNNHPVITTGFFPSGKRNRFYQTYVEGYDLNKEDNLNMKITNLPRNISQGPCGISTISDRKVIRCLIGGTSIQAGYSLVQVSLNDSKTTTSRSIPLLISP